jgi:hypothetical protein
MDGHTQCHDSTQSSKPLHNLLYGFKQSRVGLVNVMRAELQDVLSLHRKLGHAGTSTMGKINARKASDLKHFECPACIKGKGTKFRSCWSEQIP